MMQELLVCIYYYYYYMYERAREYLCMHMYITIKNDQIISIISSTNTKY
jgi:hypothetical protein